MGHSHNVPFNPPVLDLFVLKHLRIKPEISHLTPQVYKNSIICFVLEQLYVFARACQHFQWTHLIGKGFQPMKPMKQVKINVKTNQFYREKMKK